jgi:hypothetical protein
MHLNITSTRITAVKRASQFLAARGGKSCVAEGHLIIAHRFNGGMWIEQKPSPEGTTESLGTGFGTNQKREVKVAYEES